MSARRRQHEDWAPQGAGGIARWLNMTGDDGKSLLLRCSATCPVCKRGFVCYSLQEASGKAEAEKGLGAHMQAMHPAAVPA